MFLAGPFLALLLIGCLAVLALLALLLDRLPALTQVGMRAAARLEASRLIPTLWGLAAGLLVFLLAAVLFNSHSLALLGVLVLAFGLALSGLGLAVAALSAGTKLLEAFDLIETDPLNTLRLGLWCLVLAAGVPFAGWLLTLFALASGIGAVLETLVGRGTSAD